MRLSIYLNHLLLKIILPHIEETMSYANLKSKIIITANGVQADDGANAVATQNWDSIIVENGQLVSID